MSTSNHDDNVTNHAQEALENERIKADSQNAEPSHSEIEDEQPLTVEEQIEQLAELEKSLLGSNGSALFAVHKENLRLEQNLYQQRRVVIICAITAGISILCNVLLLSAFFQYPKYKTVQTRDNSVICELQPENNPEFSHLAIEDFANKAVIASYSFDYVNYADMIHAATGKYFTEEGKELFNRALRDSGFVNHILANKLSIKATPLSAAKLENQGRDKFNNLYWIVRVPVKIDFYAGSALPKASERYVAQIRVVQKKRDAFNPRGVGVKTLTLHPID